MEKQEPKTSEIERWKNLRAETETPVNEAWTAQMVAAREAAGWSHGELAQYIGANQPDVSNIETGTRRQSRLVPAICAALRLPPPHLVSGESDLEKLLESGRTLREKDPEAFRVFLESMSDRAAKTDQ